MKKAILLLTMFIAFSSCQTENVEIPKESFGKTKIINGVEWYQIPESLSVQNLLLQKRSELYVHCMEVSPLGIIRTIYETNDGVFIQSYYPDGYYYETQMELDHLSDSDREEQIQSECFSLPSIR